MNQTRGSKTKDTPNTSQPVPNTRNILIQETENRHANTPVQVKRIKDDFIPEYPIQEDSDVFKSKVESFIEISKYFSSPLRKTASYICENCLVSYPSSFRIEYKRGGVTTEHIKFCNITLEPVYVRLFKIMPDLEQIKFVNLFLSQCKRIPPGLSFNLGFMYDDVNEKPACNAKMIFVASRKTSTPCYQICEIKLHVETLKVRLVTT